MKWLLLPIAFICAAVSFPFMPFKKGDDGKPDGRWLPYKATLPPDTFARIWQPGKLFHDLKNFWVELLRALFDADAQWWAKASAFVIAALLIFAVLA